MTTVQPPARVARWMWIIVLVVGIVLFELVRRTVVDTLNPNFLPSLILIGAAVVPASFLTFVASRRLPTDVGTGPIAIAALLGGVIGTVVAGTLEYDALQRLGGLPMLVVAVIEEAAKLVIPAAMLALPRFRHGPANGLVLGVASGAGFAALETMGYALTTLVASRGNIAAVDSELLLRGLLSPAAHMAWTGLTAAALWRWVRLGHGLWWFLGTYVVAVVLHTIWDSVGGLAVYVVLAIVAFVLLLVVAHRLSHPAAARHTATAPATT